MVTQVWTAPPVLCATSSCNVLANPMVYVNRGPAELQKKKKVRKKKKTCSKFCKFQLGEFVHVRRHRLNRTRILGRLSELGAPILS